MWWCRRRCLIVWAGRLNIPGMREAWAAKQKHGCRLHRQPQLPAAWPATQPAASPAVAAWTAQRGAAPPADCKRWTGSAGSGPGAAAHPSLPEPALRYGATRCAGTALSGGSMLTAVGAEESGVGCQGVGCQRSDHAKLPDVSPPALLPPLPTPLVPQPPPLQLLLLSSTPPATHGPSPGGERRAGRSPTGSALPGCQPAAAAASSCPCWKSGSGRPPSCTRLIGRHSQGMVRWAALQAAREAGAAQLPTNTRAAAGGAGWNL